MASIDIKKLGTDMLNAALGVLKDKGPAVKSFAEGEFAKLAQTVATIEQGRLTGTISEQEAHLLLDMQRNATRAVLAAVQGMTLLVAEQAINAALAVVSGAVNTAIGFALL